MKDPAVPFCPNTLGALQVDFRVVSVDDCWAEHGMSKDIRSFFRFVSFGSVIARAELYDWYGSITLRPLVFLVGGADWKVVIQGPGGASIDVKTQVSI